MDLQRNHLHTILMLSQLRRAGHVVWMPGHDDERFCYSKLQPGERPQAARKSAIKTLWSLLWKRSASVPTCRQWVLWIQSSGILPSTKAPGLMKQTGLLRQKQRDKPGKPSQANPVAAIPLIHQPPAHPATDTWWPTPGWLRWSSLDQCTNGVGITYSCW